MGEQAVQSEWCEEDLRSFLRSLLRDLHALEKLFAEGRIENGVHRIGAEQELVIVDKAFRPAPLALRLLDGLEDPHFTTEIALFNLEINLDPLPFSGDSLSRLERELNGLLAKARQKAHECEAELTLTGILPSLRKSDLELSNLTPKPRYVSLNDTLSRMRGGAYEFRLKGADEVIVRHDSVMLEACCTSFQAHLQVGPDEFAPLYNLAQVSIAPVLAAATNSPLLFGRRLWKETRIPLFQQSVDTRSASFHLRERAPRVSFGRQWVKRSVLELLRDDISRFRVVLGKKEVADPFRELERNVPPELAALKIHNGSVYRWNRPCYGVLDGKPHLRIEMRALPAGPTVLDEVANAAFFYGLVAGLATEHPDISEVMEFEDAETNFLAAAESGLQAQLHWPGLGTLPARRLIAQELIRLAREGLLASGIISADVQRYLDVIEERVRSGQTGSRWILSSYSALKKRGSRNEALAALTGATVRRQWDGEPVHTWPEARLEEGMTMQSSELRVEEIMTTDLITVAPEEPIELVAHLMDWKHVRHVPVEDREGRLVGLVSSFEMFRHFACRFGEPERSPEVAADIMQRHPSVVAPETTVLEAISLMRREQVAALAVVKEGKLVGIVTEHDFLNLAARLIEQGVRRP